MVSRQMAIRRTRAESGETGFALLATGLPATGREATTGSRNRRVETGFTAFAAGLSAAGHWQQVDSVDSRRTLRLEAGLVRFFSCVSLLSQRDLLPSGQLRA